MSDLRLFSDPLWVDTYTIGDRVNDGVRDCTVVDIDRTAGLGCVHGCTLTVEYPDGHRCLFGFDHTFSSLGAAS